MNNYPPGVTGNEWQINGFDEFEVVVQCENDDMKVYPAHLVEQYLPEHLRMYAITNGEPCPFDDVTLVSVWGSQASWTCPLCGLLHDIDPGTI